MRQAFRASILHCLADPGEASLDSACEYLSDGLLIVENGVVAELGEADSLRDELERQFENLKALLEKSLGPSTT